MKKKVLFAISVLRGGGAERVVSVWANQLHRAGYEVSVLLHGRTEGEYPLEPGVVVRTVTPTYEECKKLGYGQRLRRMRKIVREVDPDVAVSFLPTMQIWMMAATFGRKVRRVETVRNNPWKEVEGRLAYVWKRCFSRSDAVILQTDGQAAYFSRRIRAKCTVIPNPLSDFCQTSYKTEQAEKVRTFAAVGRLSPQKNYPLMLEAFRLASERCPDIRLEIYGAGSPEEEDGIRSVIAQKGLSDRVCLMGRTDDVAAVHRQTDAFLMSSDYEGMPNALLEAMASGQVCLATDCRTGPADIISEGQTGFLTPVGDAEAMAQAMVKIVHMSRKEREEMGKRARESVLRLCSEERSLQRLIAVMEGGSTIGDNDT